MSYSEKVVDHFNNPRNVGSLDKSDEGVGTGMVGAPECGDVMKLQIRVNAAGQIIDAKFKTYGCGSAIAASSLATEWVKGKTIEQAMAIRNTEIASELALPPVKMHCSVLAEEAIKAAVADLKKKQAASRLPPHLRPRPDTYPPENKRVSVASKTGLMYISAVWRPRLGPPISRMGIGKCSNRAGGHITRSPF